MIINRERDSCFGRGFGEANSFLENLKAWLVRTPVASPASKSTGGPGWYMIYDNTAAIVPYIIVSNHTLVQLAAEPNKFDDPHMILKIEQPTTAGRVYIYSYLWYDKSTETPYGEWTAAELVTLDDSPFIYDFRGGPDFITIGTNYNTGWSFFTFEPFQADSNVAWWPYDNTVAAPLSVQANVSDTWLEFATQAEAEKFATGQWVYLYNFNQTALCEYHEVVDVDYPNKKIQIDGVKFDNFAIGSVVAAYGHRFYSYHTRDLNVTYKYTNTNIPYCSVPSHGTEYGSYQKVSTFPNNHVSAPEIRFLTYTVMLDRPDPDDEGNFNVEQSFFGEIKSGYPYSPAAYGLNESYGQSKYSYISTKTNLVQMQIGKNIDGDNFIYMFDTSNGYSAYACMIPDFDSIV